jgi:hypothetical protein
MSAWDKVNAPGMSVFISLLFRRGGNAAIMPSPVPRFAEIFRAVRIAGHRSESAVIRRAMSAAADAVSATSETAMLTSVSFFLVCRPRGPALLTRALLGLVSA